MKIICGLGNPGPEYEWTRHNVGWWALESARRAWSFPPFRREGVVRLSSGEVAGQTVLLIQPQTYMNRSGRALAPLLEQPDLEIARDLLVVVDDIALDVGRVRFRARGSNGGHNGLKSVEAVLGSQDYARVRIGVGQPPPEVDLVTWVLSEFTEEAEELRVQQVVVELVPGLETWITEGPLAAANQCNR